MKTRTKITAFVLLLLVLSILASLTKCNAQTVLNKVPILSDQPYKILIWAHESDTSTVWKYYDFQEAGFESRWGWIYTNSVTLVAEPNERWDMLFITCQDTTHLVVYGNESKTKYKGKDGYQIALNGTTQVFGIEPVLP